MSRSLLTLNDVRRIESSGPQYRFRGATPPDPTKPRAELTAGEAKDGEVTIRLYDVIDSWGGFWGISASEVAAVLDGLPSDVTQINLHINSPGGEVWEGVAITNLLRAHSARVVAVVDGLAASAASFIAVTADEVVMGQNTQMMIHDGWGICIGNAKAMHDLGSLLDKLSDNIASMYAAKAGGTTEEWRAAMLAESWYDAQEAVDVGLADRVEGAATDGGPEDHFDLSAFKFRGRAAAPAPPAAPAADADRWKRLLAARHRMNERKAPART